jgi:hypothetical protein
VDAGGVPASVGDYADSFHNFFEDLVGLIDSAATVQVDDTHPAYIRTTGVLAGFGTSDEDAVVGEATGEDFPRGLQLLVHFHTGFILEGRELRGRMFIPALTEASNNFGVPAAAHVSIVQDALDLMLFDSSVGFNNAGVVYSRAHNRAAYITSATVAPRFAWMRTRTV